MSLLYWPIPESPLRRSALRASLSGLAVVAVCAYVGQFRGLVGAAFLARTTVAYSIVMLLAIRALDTGHPFVTFGPANVVTTIRVAFVALLAGLLAEPWTPVGAWIVVASGPLLLSLDGLDGWLARRSGMAGSFGARFDMETDALLILVLAALVWLSGKAGWWVLMSGLLRYLFLAGAWLWTWLRHPLPDRIRRKVTCVIQVAALYIALFPAVPAQVSTVLAALALAVLSVSFAIDVVWLHRHGRLDHLIPIGGGAQGPRQHGTPA